MDSNFKTFCISVQKLETKIAEHIYRTYNINWNAYHLPSLKTASFSKEKVVRENGVQSIEANS